MADPQSLRPLLERVLERGDLTETEAVETLHALTDPALPPALAGALLAALRSKGVVADELRGFARAMRDLARRPIVDPALQARAIDIVGTGGDASGSVNISTGTALLVAACGLPVIKHGNRSISSRSGSADVLVQLGLPLPLDEARAGACLAATGFTFLFAPHYHPAMKAIGPVRQALGVRGAWCGRLGRADTDRTVHAVRRAGWCGYRPTQHAHACRLWTCDLHAAGSRGWRCDGERQGDAFGARGP